MLRHERRLWRKGISAVAGIDEAGRGPLAGPVVAAAVVMPEGFYVPEVRDSKQLSAEQRERLFDVIAAGARGIGVGSVDHETIDRINILRATYRAMSLAVTALGVPPGHLLVDGNRFAWDPGEAAGEPVPFTTIIDGDEHCFSIAAASIIAKVTRDRMMVEFDRLYPGYGFAHNRGYATPEHREAIFRLGHCPIHRRTFVLHAQLDLGLGR